MEKQSKTECGTEKETELKKIQRQYEILKIKYKLPEFMALAEDFDAERAAEKESSFVLRDIRRSINEKISAYIHLFETFTNPSSAPMFVFAVLKNLNEADRIIMKEIYNKLAEFEIRVFKLDTIYDEKAEAEFIILAYEEWKDLKKKIYGLFEKLGSGVGNGLNSTSRGYFG